jgi:hypothetical protein
VFWIGFLFSFGIIVQHSALLKKKHFLRTSSYCLLRKFSYLYH